MRKVILIAIVLLAVGVFCFLLYESSHRFAVRTYFQNASGLQSSAHVRVDGVDLGTVRDVHLSSEQGNKEVEVRMVIHTPYALSIPSDAVASLQTDGVLGPTFVEIDTRGAHAPALAQDGILKSEELNVSGGAARALEVIGNAMLKEASTMREKDKTQSPELNKQH